jgi:negative regulator of sigma-B (phosphoserine phosphatase)
MRFRVAHRLEACPGEIAIGDAVVVEMQPETGSGMFAIVDGLGHGPNAARAADAAVDTLRKNKDERDVMAVMQAVHANLRGTRGAAATVCILRDDYLSCCGVGNVALRSHGADVPFMLSPGILGSNVRRFRVVEARLAQKQRIVLHSDGISSDISLSRLTHLDAEATCDFIFRTHRKKNDDGAVLVIDLGE